MKNIIRIGFAPIERKCCFRSLLLCLAILYASLMQSCFLAPEDCDKKQNEANVCYLAVLAARFQCIQNLIAGNMPGSSGVECDINMLVGFSVCQNALPSACRSNSSSEE